MSTYYGHPRLDEGPKPIACPKGYGICWTCDVPCDQNCQECGHGNRLNNRVVHAPNCSRRGDQQ